MQLLQYTDNTIRTALIHYPGVDSIAVHLRGKCGSNYETASEIGAAHMLEHLLANNACKTELIKTGARAYGVTSRDHILHLVVGLKKDLDIAVKYLAQCFYTHIGITDRALEGEKKTILQEITRYENIPEKYIGRVVYKILFPKSRMQYLNSGNKKQVLKLDADNCINFKMDNYTMGNFVICAAGDINNDVLYNTIEKYFGKKTPGKINHPITFNINQNLNIQCFKFKSLKQAHLRIDFYGYTIADDMKYPLTLYANILSQKLQETLRDKQKLCYKISVNAFSSGNFGTFSIYTATDEPDVKSALKTLNDLLRDTSYITEDALQFAKNRIHTDFVLAFERPAVCADYYSEMMLFARPEQNHKYEIDKLLSLTTRNVIAAQEVICRQNPKITVISENINKDEIESCFR